MTKTRRTLTRADWLAAGRAALSATGPEALAAEPLARALGATKGSFYWHFRDLPAFRDALISDWEARALTALTQASGDTPVDGLRALARITAVPDATEPALRGWAPARDAVARVDAARHDLLMAHLRAVGITNPTMARCLQAAGLGLATLGRGDSAPDDMEQLLDLILALR